MKFWIHEDQVSGYSDVELAPEQWPPGFTLVEGPDLPLDQLYWTGSAIAEKPAKPDGEGWAWSGAEWVNTSPQLPTDSVNWGDFINEFQTPGSNTLYGSVLAKVSLSSFLVQDHWQNFKSVIQTNNLLALPGAITYLKQLLEGDENPLTSEDINGWNGLMETYGFPDDCNL